jgi:hypothetical protein
MLNLITSETNSLFVYCRFVLFICTDFTPVLFRFEKYVDVILHQQFAAAATVGLISYTGY